MAVRGCAAWVPQGSGVGGGGTSCLTSCGATEASQDASLQSSPST